MTSTTPTQTTETSTPTELLEGVQILIERMESNPEDFLRPPTPDFEYDSPSPRFAHITAALDGIVRGIEDGRDPFIHLTSDEKVALLVAYRKMMRQAFTASVISQVFDPETKPQVRVTAKTAVLGAGYGKAIVKAEGALVSHGEELRAKLMQAGIGIK